MAKKKKFRLTWSRQPSSGGLASIGEGPRGAILKVNGVKVGSVYANGLGSHYYKGWYWVANYGNLASDDKGIPVIPLRNTCDTTINEIEDAKSACEAYVRGVLDKS